MSNEKSKHDLYDELLQFLQTEIDALTARVERLEAFNLPIGPRPSFPDYHGAEVDTKFIQDVLDELAKVAQEDSGTSQPGGNNSKTKWLAQHEVAHHSFDLDYGKECPIPGCVVSWLKVIDV